MFSFADMEKHNYARSRRPTRKFLNLTRERLKKLQKGCFKQLETKTDTIRNLGQWNKADSTTATCLLKEWLKMHDCYYKHYEKYCTLLTNTERKEYEDECKINNDWLADIKIKIEQWFENIDQPAPIIPLKPKVNKETEYVDVEELPEVEHKAKPVDKEAPERKTNASLADLKKMKQGMEKIHVAPLSSKSIPALFAVPSTDKTVEGNAKTMRLCKRVIYIKNGISYSHYVPVTQVEADAKNMFGIERVVNVLDEKHQFKRHMVIKNWVNHVKPAKGTIAAIPSKNPEILTTVMSKRFVQVPVSVPTPVTASKQVTSKNQSAIVTPNQGTIKYQFVQPNKLIVQRPKVGTTTVIPYVSSPQTALTISNLTKTTATTKNEHSVSLSEVLSNSKIKISSICSLSGDKPVEFKAGSSIINTQPQASNSNVNLTLPSSNQQTVGNIVPVVNNQTFNENLTKTLFSQTSTGIPKLSNIISDNKQKPGTVYLLMTHNGQQCLVQTKQLDKVMTHVQKPSLQDDKVVEILSTKSKSKSKKKKSKKSEHKKYRKGKKRSPKKTMKRSYSPSESSSSDCDESTENNDSNYHADSQTASFQMLKGVNCAQVENKIVRKNKVLKIQLSKLAPLATMKTEKESESETESSSETDGCMPSDFVVKEEPLDPSDDSDSIGYLNSFIKEQQSTINTIMDQTNQNMQFPLVMIKKEPVSDNEDIADQEPVTSTVTLPVTSTVKIKEEPGLSGIKIKEEPLSDEDDQHFNTFESQCQTRFEEQPTGVCTSREDRVKQLKEKIREKQTVLAAFRKRPRISLVDNI